MVLLRDGAPPNPCPMPELTLPKVRRPWVKERSDRPHGNRPHQKQYHTTKWRNDRAAHLAENPLCVKCLEEDGRHVEATVSDHIDPVEQGGDMWDWKNRQALCSSHHNRKSGSEKGTQ